MTQKIRIESNKLLIIEGKDEEFFFKALLKHENIDNFQIIGAGGKDRFPQQLRIVVNLQNFSEVVDTLGFVRDAEQNKANSAFSSICDQLRRNNLPVPTSINEVIEEEGRRIGIFIMPNNSDEGMLEDLCIESIKKNGLF